MWRMAPHLQGVADRATYSSASVAPISVRWQWLSSKRWCLVTFTCWHQRTTGSCRTSCLLYAYRNDFSSMLSEHPLALCRHAPIGVALQQSERWEIFTARIGHAGIQQFKVTNRSAACDLVTVADVSKVVRGAS